MEGYNNFMTNASQEEDLTSLNQCDDPNDTINNERKEGTWEICYSKKKKRKNENVASFLLQVCDVKANNSNNKSSTFYHANNKNINNDSKSNTNTVKHNNNVSDKNTSTSILKKDGLETYDTKKKKGKKAYLEKGNVQTNTIVNNSIEKTLLLANKKNDDDSILSKITDLTIDIEYNNGDNSVKDNFTLQNLTDNDIQETFRGEKNILKKKRKNSSTDNDDCNKFSVVNSPSTSTAKFKNSESDEDTSTLIQDSKHVFFNVNYKFHEANHAIIDTFALNIYFSLCADDKKTFCLVCDETFKIKNDNLREQLCRHIRSNKHIELLSQMIEDDKNYIKDGKLYSKLGLAQEYMKSMNDFVECLLCDNKNFPSKIKNNEESLQEHVTSSKHQNFKASWTSSVKNILREIHNNFRSKYNAEKYCCDLCKYESSSEIYFIKHLRVPYHMTRLVEIPDHAEKFKFHFCAACSLLWFGSSKMYDRHCEEIEHKHKAIYGSDLDHIPEQVVQFLIMSNENAEALLEKSNHICYNDETVNYILHNLITDLRRFLPLVKAYPFGSRISDLGFPNSDIDIFLDCDNMYEGRNSTHRHCQTLIVMVVYYLSFNKQVWKVEEMILNSRTPIAKVRHVLSGLVCDISVTNGLAVENTKIIKCFNRAFPLCRKMILFLKRWLHFCDLLGSRLVTSYALTWCVIFYLQTLLVFPSISELIKIKNKSWRISGWEVGVSYDFPIRKKDYTFEELLLGFFIFYAEFNYKNHIICPLLGKLIKKKAFTNLSNLPQDMITYINYMQNTSTEERPQALSTSTLCVQDPFDLSHNLTKAVSKCKLKQFQMYCNYSAKILKKTIPHLKPPL